MNSNETHFRILFQIHKNLKESYPEKYEQMFDYLITNLNKPNTESNDNKKFIEMNTIIAEMNFYLNHFSCKVGLSYSENCENISKIIPSLSYLGKCHTFLFEQNINSDSNKISSLRNNKPLITITKPNYKLNYFVNKLYVHARKTLPSLSLYDEIYSNFDHIKKLEINEYYFRKLESPYDTHCKKYIDKTRSDCLNECYLKLSNRKCITDKDMFITIKINSNTTKPKIPFCSAKNNISFTYSHFGTENVCEKVCPVSCEERIFMIENVNDYGYRSGIVNLDFQQNYYFEIIYWPKMIFFQYIIGIANLISLWHGIDIKFLIHNFLRIIIIAMRLMKIKKYYIVLKRFFLKYKFIQLITRFLVILSDFMMRHSKVFIRTNLIIPSEIRLVIKH